MQQVMGMPMVGGQMGQPQLGFPDGMQSSQQQVANGMSQSQMAMQQQNQNQSRRPMTFQELRDRAQVVQSTIKNMEADLSILIRSGKPQHEVMAETMHARGILNGRKQLLGKLVQAMQTMKAQGVEHVTMEWVTSLPPPGTRLTPGHSLNSFNLPSSSPAPPPQPQMSVQGNQQWLPRPGPSPSNGLSLIHI